MIDKYNLSIKYESLSFKLEIKQNLIFYLRANRS